MARLSNARPLEHPKYEVYRCPNLNDIPHLKLYRVKLYCIFSDHHIYLLYNQSDWIDQINLIREQGFSCSTFTQDIYVSSTSHSDMYHEIDSYVSNSNND